MTAPTPKSRAYCAVASASRDFARMASDLADALREIEPEAMGFITRLEQAAEDGLVIGRSCDLKAQEALLNARKTGWKD